MPTRAPRACPGCGCPLQAGQKCAPCTRRQDAPRGTAHQRGYTYRWAQYSQRWRARFPFCGQRADGQFYAEHSKCVQEGRKVLCDVVDHITSIKDGGSIFDPANHQSLCNRCNTAKS